MSSKLKEQVIPQQCEKSLPLEDRRLKKSLLNYARIRLSLRTLCAVCKPAVLVVQNQLVIKSV